MAVPTPDRGNRRPIQPADLCQLRSVGDVALHPNFSDTVFVVRWPDLETDANRSILQAVASDGSNHRQLTEGHRDNLPVFSPAGSRLAFARHKPKEPGRLMILDWPVGEIRQVAEFADGGPTQIRWADENRLLVSAPQRPDDQVEIDDEELARRPKIITTNRYRFNGRGYIFDRPNQLWMVRLPSNGTADDGPIPLGSTGLDHESFAVSPDGSRVAAVVVSDIDADLAGTNRVWLYDIDRASVDASPSPDPMLLTEAPAEWGTLVWHPEGELWASGNSEPTETKFFQWHRVDPRGSAAPEKVAHHDQNIADWTMAGNGIVAVAGAVLAPGIRRGRVGIDRHSLSDGTRTTVFEDDAQVLAFDGNEDATLIMAAITSPTRPAELWRIADGVATKVVSLNDKILDRLELAAVEPVQVPSGDGSVVEAFVTRPPESVAPATPGPGLVYVHGGPMFQYGYGFFDEFQMAAAAGYVVIGGNPRGSDGYGEDWALAIIGQFGRQDWEDVQALTDYLAGLEEVDGDRLGIGGGSYGGFMSAWALAHDNAGRYQAGLIERSVVGWYSMYGTSDIGNWFTKRTIKATIEDDLDGVFGQSPLTHAASITAPTLIVHSEEDWRCPIEQAEQLFTAIRRNGGRATLVRFPGENHELSRGGQPKHRIERFEIIHEFYARHLGGADFGTTHLVG